MRVKMAGVVSKVYYLSVRGNHNDLDHFKKNSNNCIKRKIPHNKRLSISRIECSLEVKPYWDGESRFLRCDIKDSTLKLSTT